MPAKRAEGSARGTDRLIRRSAGVVTAGPLEEMLPGFAPAERWLFVTPHDDDPIIAAALFLRIAVRAGVSVAVRVVSDGRMGYTSACGPDRIVATRAEETRRSFAHLGITDLSWYGYPDAQLHLWRGRREADESDTARMPGRGARFVGIQNDIVADLRRVRPSRVFSMAGTDLHPDHQVSFHETRMSLFHSAGDIWPDLGEPLDPVPPLYEFAAYSPFVEAPDWQIEGDEQTLEVKLAAIREFASQTQLARLFKLIIERGAVEHMRTVAAAPYDPDLYTGLFSEIDRGGRSADR